MAPAETSSCNKPKADKSFAAADADGAVDADGGGGGGGVGNDHHL